jgi:hypothetical protein
MLKNIELNLGLLYGELSDLSLQIYSNQNLNDLMTAYYQSGASSVDETDFAQSNLNDEIQNMLGQYVDTHNYIQSIQLSINNTPFYAAKDSSHMISAAENFELKKWFPDIYDANGKIVVIPSYAQQYSSNYSSITNEFIISFAREVKNLREIYKNERIGVLDIDFQESYLKNLYGDANVSKNSFTMITTQDGAIISATEDSLIDKSVLKEGYRDN